MIEKTRPADLYIRLPENKKYIKTELVSIAKKNNMTYGALITYALEWFLEEKKQETFSIKLK